eukprot:s165_g40.t1
MKALQLTFSFVTNESLRDCAGIVRVGAVNNAEIDSSALSYVFATVREELIQGQLNAMCTALSNSELHCQARSNTVGFLLAWSGRQSYRGNKSFVRCDPNS